MRAGGEAIRMVKAFNSSPEEEKSQELILALLELTPAPFSRRQFHPGHITCTALVLDPARQRALLVYHHRLRRWLLPGGHVEECDVSLSDTARREAMEETAVRIAADASLGELAGLDVHGIPAHPGKDEPFHLHHDLIFALQAESSIIARSEEAPEVTWCALAEFERYEVPSVVVRAAIRASAAALR